MLKIIEDKCIGCGMCAGMCPEAFVMGMGGKAEVAKSEINDCVKNAAENCPVEAIIIK
ncbi:MAG: ferredoxin [Patescibacteria group bacterium]